MGALKKETYSAANQNKNVLRLNKFCY